MEPYANLNHNCFRSLYIDYKDYITFLDKIINCFTNIKIKMKFQNYFFNKFLIENVLQNILSYFLLGLNELNSDTDNNPNEESNNNDNNNNDINNNSQINNDESSEESSDNISYIYQIVEYDPNKIRNKLLKNMSKTKEYINIIIFEIFNI